MDKGLSSNTQLLNSFGQEISLIRQRNGSIFITGQGLGCRETLLIMFSGFLVL